jgi:hypothetical protein
MQAEANRAVMGAADLVVGEAPGGTLLEDPADVVGVQFPDLAFSLETYAASRQRFGAPALSVEQIESAAPLARAAADHFLARALSIELVPAARRPHPLPAAIGASQTGGVLERSRGCLRFVPLAAGAQLSLRLMVGGLWVRPAVGSPVPIGVERFSEDFGVSVDEALADRASVLKLPPSHASSGWRAQFSPSQPLLLCAS